QTASPQVSTRAIAAPSDSLAMRASSVEYVFTGIKKHKFAVVAVLALLIVAAISLMLYLRTRNEQAAIESIAVLPFENQSNNSDADYISDGITISINNSLTRVPQLKVIPNSVTSHYKGKALDLRKIGEELDVSAVLTGKVMQRGDNVIISVELDDVR